MKDVKGKLKSYGPNATFRGVKGEDGCINYETFEEYAKTQDPKPVKNVERFTELKSFLKEQKKK